MDDKISISIFDEINSNTLKSVIDATSNLPDGAEVELVISSYGGEILPTFAIIDALKRFHTHAIALGFSCSAAAILAISCDEVSMSETSSLMLHSAWADTADNIDPGILRCNELQLDIIHRRCPEFDASLLKQDTWLSADDCIKLHLADYISNNYSIDYAACCKKYAAKLSAIKSVFKGENAMDENVREVIEEVKEEEEKAPEAEEDAPAEENHDLIEVIEKLSEEMNALKARIVALEEMKEDVKEEEIEAEAGCDDDRERINNIYRNIVAPQARVAIGTPKAATNAIVHKVDYKKYKNFIND